MLYSPTQSDLFALGQIKSLVGLSASQSLNSIDNDDLVVVGAKEFAYSLPIPAIAQTPIVKGEEAVPVQSCTTTDDLAVMESAYSVLDTAQKAQAMETEEMMETVDTSEQPVPVDEIDEELPAEVVEAVVEMQETTATTTDQPMLVGEQPSRLPTPPEPPTVPTTAKDSQKSAKGVKKPSKGGKGAIPGAGLEVECLECGVMVPNSKRSLATHVNG